MNTVRTVDDTWVVVVPIQNLNLANYAKKEISLLGVTFIDRQKFFRVKHVRFKIKTRSKDIIQFYGMYEMDHVDAFAIVTYTGTIQESKTLSLIRKATYIVSSSQLGYTTIKNKHVVSVLNEISSKSIPILYLSRNNNSYLMTGKTYNSVTPLEINKRWLSFHKDTFFMNLLKIINKETKVSTDWRDTLIRVAVLIGKSINSREVADSFLWNMIAIETLLMKPKEKFVENTLQRIEAFLGWLEFWDAENYKTSLNMMYTKRNNLVHNGKQEDITSQDVIFTNMILFNLLINILNYPKIFTSKEAVIAFNEKIAAEKILGIKSVIRPKGFKFFLMLENDDGFES